MFNPESPNLLAPLRLRLQAARFLGTVIESQSQDAAPDGAILVALADDALRDLEHAEAALRRESALVFSAGLLGSVGLLDLPASSTAIH